MNIAPEHLHVAINHIPLVGLAVALLPLLIGLVGRRKESLFIGLLLTLICAGSIPVVMWSGEEAEHEWLHTDAASHLNAEGHEWAEIHEDRAELGSKTIYVTAGLALLSLIGMAIGKCKGKLKKTTLGLSILTTLACAASVVAAAWIADSGGKISHPEFRDSTLWPAEHDGLEDDASESH